MSLKAHWNGECTPQTKRSMCWVNKKPVSLLSTHSYVRGPQTKPIMLGLGMCMVVCGNVGRGGGCKAANPHRTCTLRIHHMDERGRCNIEM